MPVNNDRDEIDSWLDADVQPLPPPPGTFDRVSRQARRRKAGRAIVSAAGAAVLVTGLAFTPKVAGSLFSQPAGQPEGSAISSPPLPPPTPSNPGGGNGTPAGRSSSAVPTPAAASSLSPGGSGQPVPARFRPTSVTFIGTHMGAVIGQAGTPGNCGPPVKADCTSLAGTSNYGTTWYGVSAPVTGAPAGSAGVSGLRFLDTRTGWAFGPELWVTHDGGAHWRQESTRRLRVISLETAGNRAFALFASCAGTGADFAAHCTSFRLFSSSSAAGGDWRPVPGAARDLRPAGTAAAQVRSASAGLVLVAGPVAAPEAGTGYVLAPSGTVLSGPLTGGPWTVNGQAPCQPAVVPGSGQPARAAFTAGSNELFVACTSAAPGAGGLYVKNIWASADGGKHWQRAGPVSGPGIATSLAAAQGGLVVLATTTCIDVSADGGGTWRQVYGSPPGAAAGLQGFSYVGMTDSQHGVAVPADTSLHEILITSDGGSSWQSSLVSSG